MVPVALWALGRLLSGWPDESAAGVFAAACHTLWLITGLTVAGAVPLLLQPAHLAPQLLGVLWLVAAPAPLYAMAVVAGAVSWQAAAGAVAGGSLVAALLTLGLAQGLRRLTGGGWEHPYRLVTAWGLVLAAWMARDDWLAALTGL